MKNLMIVDDDIIICETLTFALRYKYSIITASNSEEALKIYSDYKIDLVITDLRIGTESGIDLYEKLKKINNNCVVILMTAYGDTETIIKAIKKGIFHYINKPINLEELELNIDRGLKVVDLYSEIENLNLRISKKYNDYGIIADSNDMKTVIDKIEKVKDINSTILFTGESGTGKTMLAKQVHYQGNRKNKVFNVINCAAIPNNLLESELFGYKRGAFTGAANDRKGMFELSEGGTLLLDEIGEMDISLQSKLLRVIQEKEIFPLGGTKPVKVDVRLIAATNQNLQELIAEGKFRNDLYYRLNVINIEVPPLRKRKEDMLKLLELFIYKYSTLLGKNVTSVSDRFYKAIGEYSFPGNIRELENIIERAIALSDGESIDYAEIIDELEYNKDFKKTINKKLVPIFIGTTLAEAEKKIILETLKSVDYNQVETARILNVSDRTIRNKIKKYRESVDE